MDSTNRIPNIHGFHFQTVKIIEILKDGKPGDTLADSDLSERVGIAVGVGEPGYAKLQSAMRYCLRTHAVGWARVKGAGKIVCMDATGLIGSARSIRKQIQRRANRATTMIAVAVDRKGELTDTERSTAMVEMAQHQALAMISRGDVAKKIEQAGPTQDRYDPRKLIESFTKK